MGSINIFKCKAFVAMLSACVIALCLTGGSESFAGDNKTIIELWEDVKAPKLVELKRVKLDPKRTAFLMNGVKH